MKKGYLRVKLQDQFRMRSHVDCCMPFANDIILVDDTKMGVQAKLELWREFLDFRSFIVSRTKNEFMESVSLIK